ncbi:hypothetical protein [Caldisericum sp. AR60]|uniref:hypothetical protein n=1 Tax=Caldisericum sp. AR60 TaxID=3397852 RepID=UPI0039FBA0BC
MVTSFLGPDKYSLDGGITWNDLWLEIQPWENMLSTKVFCINGIWYFNGSGSGGRSIWKIRIFLNSTKL